jgi:electron transport complex protein RnfE
MTKPASVPEAGVAAGAGALPGAGERFLSGMLPENPVFRQLLGMCPTLAIASFVTMADRFLAAFLPDMSRLLGPYIPLIIVNCLIISRAEACASKQGTWPALWDGLGQGGGFVLGLLCMGAVRELLGAGSLLGWQVMPAFWTNWVIMLLPAGGFLTLGALIALVNWYSQRRAATARSSEAQP